MALVEEEPPSKGEVEYRVALEALVETFEPRTYATSLLKANETSDNTINYSEVGILVLLIAAVISLILLYAFMNKDKPRVDTDDCFVKQLDEEVMKQADEEDQSIHPNAATAAFSKSFDLVTVKTEKSNIFKRSVSQVYEANMNSILKKPSTPIEQDNDKRSNE